MADAQRVIEIVFNGVDRTSAVIDGVIGNTSKLSSNIQQATQPLADFTVGAVKLEAGLLAAGAAMTILSTKVAADFDTAFREIATLIDQPIDNLADFKQAILDYASTSTAGLDQVTQAVYAAISAGVDFEDSIAAVNAAEKLSVASKADLNDTLVVLVSSLNAYGLGMDDAERFSDALFTTVKQGQTTLPELAASLSRVTGLAATTGVSFEELLAAVAALTSTGAPTSQAITSIQQALSNIIKPSSQAAALAAELGIEFNATALKTGGLKAVLDEASRATGGNAEQMALLFGSVEALGGVMNLTGKASEAFADNLVEMASKTGATEAAFTKMADSLNLSASKVSNAFKVLLVNVGTPFLDEFGGIAEAIAGIFNSLGASVQDGNFGDLVAYIESVLGDLENAIQTVARNLPAALEQADLSGFSDGIQAVIDGFSTLFGEIDITSVDGLAKAITLAGEAFASLSFFTKGVIESFKPLFDQLVELGGGMEGVGREFFEAAGSIGGFATQANILAGGINSLLPTVEALLNLLLIKQGVGLVGGLGQAATQAKTLAGALGTAGLAGAAAFVGYEIGNKLVDPLNDLVNKNTETEQSLGTLVFDLHQSVLGFLGFETVTQRVNDTLGPLSGNMDTTATAAGETALALDDISGAAGGAAKGLADISSPAEALAVAATEAAKGNYELADSMLNAVNPVLPKLQDGMDQLGVVYDQHGNIVNDLIPVYDDVTGAITGFREVAVAANDDVGGSFRGIVPIIDEATGAVIGYEEGWVETGSAIDAFNKEITKSSGGIDQAKEAMDKAVESTLEWKQALLEASTEITLEQIRSETEITVAEIEAGARAIEAAYESINTSISVTGDTLSTLFGLLGDADSLRDKFDLQRQIDIQNERQQEALDLQKDLTKAQIKEIEARADALERGDSLITVQADGLQPHLEAIWFEIFRGLQVRVSADGLDQLLPPVAA